ncbi:MAG: hypothetical protein DMF62_11700 [Acidobacteria bacterium]|nr:MAG: hypothetical protein DMF62_11700 [Acidobacteriota bacterium]
MTEKFVLTLTSMTLAGKGRYLAILEQGCIAVAEGCGATKSAAVHQALIDLEMRREKGQNDAPD